MISRRRTFSLSAAAGLAQFASAHARPLDLSDPQDSLYAVAKLRGDVSGTPALLWYTGTGFAVVPGEVPHPLYRVQGLIRSAWVPQPDGSFLYETFDLGFYGDKDTGAYLETFVNPLNGKTCAPVHVHDGPQRSVYSVDGSHPVGAPPDTSKTLAIDWQRSGDEIWFENSFGFAFPSPLRPEDWPEASPGETVTFRFHTSFRGRMSELEDDSTTAAPLTAVYLGIGPWPPWLLMEQAPGYQVLQYQARKLVSEDEIPVAMQEYIARTEPAYLTAEEPWSESLSSWERYERTRQPQPRR
jgi:hypothetical protein